MGLTEEENAIQSAIKPGNRAQLAVYRTMIDVFKDGSPQERLNRHIEEFFELVQSLGVSTDTLTSFMNDVYAKPPGQPHQEIAGDLITLLALAESHSINAFQVMSNEIRRVLDNREVSYAKHLTKRR